MERPPPTLLSAIVVNWNGKPLLKDCLESILAPGDPEVEVLLVDNGSSDGSSEFVRETFGAKVRRVELSSNEGWAGGNNRGIEAARGEYVLLLNNDACLDGRFFESLRDGMARYPGEGMYAVRILDDKDRTVIDNTGHVIFWDGTARGRGRGRKDGPEFDGEGEALCPSGAAGVYRREIFGRLGPIDEEYFTYGEDTELGLRARMAGYRCRYLSGARVYHRYSATAGPFTPRKVYYVERNRVFTLIKLFPWPLVLLSPFFTLARYGVGLWGLAAGRGAVGRLRAGHGVREILGAVARAYVDALRRAGAMLRKRRALRDVSTMGRGEFFRTLWRFRARIREVSYNE